MTRLFPAYEISVKTQAGMEGHKQRSWNKQAYSPETSARARSSISNHTRLAAQGVALLSFQRSEVGFTDT